MMSTMVELERVDAPVQRVAEWRLTGRAQLPHRPEAFAWLTVRADGTWSAEVTEFTLLGELDLLFVADGGGHFCGPAFVERSAANDTQGVRMGTWLTGTGPLLVVDPGSSLPELPPSGDMVEGEVVDG